MAAEPLKLELNTITAQIEPGSSSHEIAEIVVTLSGKTAVKLSIEPIDIVLEEKGKSLVPAGSTNYTLKNQLVFTPGHFEYQPNGGPQQFVFQVSARDPSISEVRYGGLQVTASPQAAKNSSASGSLAAVATFAIVPAGLDLNLPKNQVSSATLSNLQLVQAKRQTLADWIFPDLPGVVNSGPVKLVGKLTNKNELPVFSRQTVSWLSDGKQLVTVDLPQRLLLADQSIDVSSSSTTKIAGSNIEYNFAKQFQNISVEVQEQSFLGSRQLDTQTVEVSVLVLPWKEWLLGLLLGTGLIVLLIRIRKGKSRPKQKSKREPTTLWLFLVWVYKNLKRRLIHRQ